MNVQNSGIAVPEHAISTDLPNEIGNNSEIQ